MKTKQVGSIVKVKSGWHKGERGTVLVKDGANLTVRLESSDVKVSLKTKDVDELIPA